MEREKKRICSILGTESVPGVTEEHLRAYHAFLKEHLSFPFRVSFSKEVGPLEFKTIHFKAKRLMDIDFVLEHSGVGGYGLFCEGRGSYNRKYEMPLTEIRVEKEGKNKQLIEDYNTWFVNYREETNWFP